MPHCKHITCMADVSGAIEEWHCALRSATCTAMLMHLHMCCCRMDTTKWPEMPEQERKRKLFVIGFLETGSDAEAAAFSGLNPRHTRQRIAEHLRQHGNLSEAPHPRPSPKYTENVMKAAFVYFKDNPNAHFATPELVSYLVREGFLEEPVDRQNFR